MQPMVKDSTIAWTAYSAVVRIHSSGGGNKRLCVDLIYLASRDPVVCYPLFVEAFLPFGNSFWEAFKLELFTFNWLTEIIVDIVN